MKHTLFTLALVLLALLSAAKDLLMFTVVQDKFGLHQQLKYIRLSLLITMGVLQQQT